MYTQKNVRSNAGNLSQPHNQRSTTDKYEIQIAANRNDPNDCTIERGGCTIGGQIALMKDRRPGLLGPHYSLVSLRDECMGFL